MRVLLDESLPRALARELPGHAVRTVQWMGWSGRKNGELLRLAAREFDVLVTGDQSMEYQTNHAGLGVAIVVLVARSNRLEALQPLVPSLLAALEAIQVGEVRRVELP
jgi:predicted nuclease of predicted toxin-antitoxin system